MKQWLKYVLILKFIKKIKIKAFKIDSNKGYIKR